MTKYNLLKFRAFRYTLLRSFIILWTVIGTLMWQTGCELNDNEAPVPSYIFVENPILIMPGTINTPASHKITDVWVIADGQVLGIFPLPAHIPMEVTGQKTSVEIRGGIRNNGMNENAVEYAFFEPVKFEYTAVPLDTINVPLVFTYKNETRIPINENFEGNNRFNVNLNPNNPVALMVTSDEASSGSKSGMVELTPQNNFMELASNDFIKKEEHSRGRSYIEFDYKGEDEIAVGVVKVTNSNPNLDVQYVLFVPGKNEWNRIYVDLTNTLSPHNFDHYHIVLGFTKLRETAISRTYIDNIRHVHF